MTGEANEREWSIARLGEHTQNVGTEATNGNTADLAGATKLGAIIVACSLSQAGAVSTQGWPRPEGVLVSSLPQCWRIPTDRLVRMQRNLYPCILPKLKDISWRMDDLRMP